MILQNLSKEIYPVSNYEVFSDIGWVPIQYAIKTIELKKYVVLFQSGREVSCADVHIFIDNEYREIYAKDLFEGKTLLTEDGIDTVFDVFETDEFCEMYDINLPYHNLFYANGVLSHNSAMMINIAARQVLMGYNVVMITLEMSEDSIAQRMDAIYSGMDINRLYVVKDSTKTLIKKLDDLNKKPGLGKLFIKEFPTGDASVIDIKRYLRELKMRGIVADIVFVDYINLMKSSNKNINDLYGTVKKIAEELRAMAFAFNVPVVSVSQLNREGSNIINLKEIDFTHISECLHPDTFVDKFENNTYKKIKMSDLNIGDNIRGENDVVVVKNIFPYKKKKMYKIKTESGKEIICSADHMFPTDVGMLSISTGLNIGKNLYKNI